MTRFLRRLGSGLFSAGDAYQKATIGWDSPSDMSEETVVAPESPASSLVLKPEELHDLSLPPSESRFEIGTPLATVDLDSSALPPGMGMGAEALGSA